jgi:hypothetical protein
LPGIVQSQAAAVLSENAGPEQKKQAPNGANQAGVGMSGVFAKQIVLAVVASLIFMAGVRVAVETAYPDGTANLSKGKIAVVALPGKQVAKR